MRGFFVELVEYHKSQRKYAKSRCFVAGAAQGFSLRRTYRYAASGKPRRTTLSGKRAISGWKLLVLLQLLDVLVVIQGFRIAQRVLVEDGPALNDLFHGQFHLFHV